jgi:exopolysaccharide biosynthesis polyprenyl glycosylphosphotransferase
VDRALVIGSGEVGRSVIRTLLARPDLGFQAIGYLHTGTTENNIGSGRIPHLGSFSELGDILAISNPKIDTVFVALPNSRQEEIEESVRLCQLHGVHSRVVPDLFQLSLNRVEFNNMAGIPMLSVREVRISPIERLIKRAIDLAISLVLIIPVMIITGLIIVAIRLESPGPVLFWQERIGMKGRPFKMVKFRSMVVDAESQKEQLRQINEASGPIFKIKNDPRLTKVGRIIRRLSLDELPQLYNVLRGEMSLVGPRPPLAEEVAKYQPWHMQRLEVKGGITGLWVLRRRLPDRRALGGLERLSRRQPVAGQLGGC